MTFWVRYLEIFTTFSLQAKCFHDIFPLHFQYISRHFHDKFSLQKNFTTSFHDIFTTNFHDKGTNRQGRTDSMGTHRQIFTTNFHYKKISPHLFTTFSLQIFTTKGRTDSMGTHRQIFTTNFHDRSHSHESVIWGTNRQKLVWKLWLHLIF